MLDDPRMQMIAEDDRPISIGLNTEHNTSIDNSRHGIPNLNPKDFQNEPYDPNSNNKMYESNDE